MVATRTGSQKSPKKLKFNEKLTGKGFTTDALLKKLKNLHTELAELDQDLVDANSLSGARKELINTSILLHKDKGVKAYTACCLADILRLYAPDAPYTHTELRDIFQFFVKQLTSGLTSADCAYYNEYFHLLESLSTVKSVVLVCDLPQADSLMKEIFRGFFGIVRRSLPKKIEIFMADILVALIEESQSLPVDVLESILSQFMDKNSRMEQPAYRLAVDVCNKTADRLQRHVCQFFSDIIILHSEEEGLEDVEKAHELIKKLNHSCPSLLHNVIPQLEEELKVELVPLRVMATQVLGEMFADVYGGDLVKKFPSTWQVWLSRKNDRTPSVRVAFVEAAKGLISKPPEIHKAIEEVLQSKLLDPDEKVRAAVCKVYSQLDYETVVHHVSEEMLRSLAGRGADKRQSVRSEALNALGRLYGLAYPEIENDDPRAISHFSWIPQEILHLCKVGVEVRAQAEQIVVEQIFPFPSPPATSSSRNNEIDESAWVERLLTTMRYLDASAVGVLLSVSGLKIAHPSLYDRYVQACVEYNGGVGEGSKSAVAKLNATIERIARQSHDPQKVSDDLHTFANLNEGRLYKLMSSCMDPQTDLKALIRTTNSQSSHFKNDFLKRLGEHGASTSSIVPTMTYILRRASLRIVNQSSIPPLIRRIQRASGDGETQNLDELGDLRHAQTVLSYASKHCPAVYKPHVAELTKAIADEKKPRLIEVCLQALAAVAKWDAKLAPSDKRTTERLMRFVHQSNPRHAKFAARLLTCSKNSSELCSEVINTIANEMAQADSNRLLAHIAVLAEFASSAPDAFEQQSDIITAFLLSEILMAPTSLSSNAQEEADEWVSDENLTPELRSKLLSIKIYRNRCLAHASSESALDVATPVVKMLITLLEHDGSLKGDTQDDPRVKSRMRLAAATALLQLASVPAYASAIAPNFVLLAIMVQDPCFRVRLAFVQKVVSALQMQKVPYRYNIIPFLTALDPEAEVIKTARAYVTYAIRALPAGVRLEHFELLFIRLLHVLAHHPDFSTAHEALVDIARYIELYLELVSSRDNISLLYHLSMKAKTVRDADSTAHSENLYIASEMAQELIKARAHAHSWNLESYPGKLKLPSDILRPLPNAEVVNKILKRSYLPAETVTWLTDRTQKNATKEKVRTAPKRKAEPKLNRQTKRSKVKRSRRGRDEDEDDDEEDDDSGVGSDETDGDVKMRAVDEGDASEKEEERRPERLGRSARTKANAKIKEQTKRKKRTSGRGAASSDDS
ncbi:hypothetical protein OE88DRAFT_1646400 [Heliocybe sulcata]|uniref:ARM repeat-containing protein n=1 Tax=Heliocybe sulcata TaxID=5364 RepID=A0A5C3MV52_9AGAM|nr:hypothetical protein OE88DRAFT_1646400 [Heliocybe sulcata]